MPIIRPASIGGTTLQTSGCRRWSSQITTPLPLADLGLTTISINDEDSGDEDGDFDARETDSLITRRASSTSLSVHGTRRVSNFGGVPDATDQASRRRTSNLGEQLKPSDQAEPTPLEGKTLLYTSALITIFGGLQLGWQITQLNLRSFHNAKDCAAQPIKPGTCIIFPGHSDVAWIAAVMAWVLGAAVGALLSSIPAKRFGRRFVIVGNAVIMVLGGALQTFAPNIYIFAMGRLFSGITSGSGSTIASVYLGEICPAHQRGSFVVAFQVATTTGLIAAVSSHFAVSNSPTSWRWIMAFPMLIGFIQLLASPFFLTESPKWLLVKHRHKDAVSTFQALYKHGNFQELENTVQLEEEKAKQRQTAVKADSANANNKSGSFWRDAFSPRCQQQFIISCILCMARQFGGVSAVFFYSSSIFAEAGIEDSRVGNLMLGVVSLLAVLVICAFMKKLPRRLALLFGIAGMIFCSVGVTFGLVNKHPVSILFTALYVMFNSLSLNPLPFLVTAEVLPEHIKTEGISFTTFLNWFCNLLVGIFFPILAYHAGNYIFLPFTGLLVVFWLCVYTMLPETRSKTNEEIQQAFVGQESVLGYFKSLNKFSKLDDTDSCGKDLEQGTEESISRPTRKPTTVDIIMPIVPPMPTLSRTA